jgi:hypothetical protein
MQTKLVIGVLIILLSTCSMKPPTPTESGIEGQVVIGPICPVAQEGQECPDQPYQALLTVTSSKGERIVQVQTDENGMFKIPLAPGEYVLHPESPNRLPFASEQSVVVEAGRFTQVSVTYDSGIR